MLTFVTRFPPFQEYLLFRFQRSVVACVTNPQGGTDEENEKLKEAQERVQQLNEALAKLQVQLAQEKELEAKARQAEVSRGSWAFGPCSCFSCSQIGGLIVVGPFSLWQSVFRTFC